MPDEKDTEKEEQPGAGLSVETEIEYEITEGTAYEDDESDTNQPSE